jgi:hypothetical protein
MRFGSRILSQIGLTIVLKVVNLTPNKRRLNSTPNRVADRCVQRSFNQFTAPH